MPDRIPEGVSRAGRCFAEQAFQLGEGPLDGVEVGRVRRQRHEGGADRPDRCLNARDLVGREVVEHHDVAGPERQRQLSAIGYYYYGSGIVPQISIAP